MNNLRRVKPITKEKHQKYLKQMRQANKESRDDDAESWHIKADDILCELLNELGFKQIVEEYGKVKRWYS